MPIKVKVSRGPRTIKKAIKIDSEASKGGTAQDNRGQYRRTKAEAIKIEVLHRGPSTGQYRRTKAEAIKIEVQHRGPSTGQYRRTEADAIKIEATQRGASPGHYREAEAI